MPKRIVIAGGRDFLDYDLLKEKVQVFIDGTDDVEIVSGGARGADSLGERYAAEVGLALKVFPAKCDLYGKRAGHIRNVEMADYADAVICFWDGASKGTGHMIRESRARAKQVVVIEYSRQ